MKKLLIAAIAASLVMAFTGCGSDDDSSSSKKDKSSKASVTSSETAEESKAEESKADESSAEESKAEESSAAESSADSSNAEKGLKDGVFTGTGYTIKVDEKLWTNASDTNSMADCMFMYAGGGTDAMAATANFNIIAQPAGTFGSSSPADYAEIIKKQYDSTEGYSVTGGSEMTVNGRDAYLVSVDVSQSENFTMNMNQIIIIENGYIYAISYGAEKSAFANIESDFNDVINSFTVL